MQKHSVLRNMFMMDSHAVTGRQAWVRCFCCVGNVSKHTELREFCQGRFSTPIDARDAVLEGADAVAEQFTERRIRLQCRNCLLDNTCSAGNH